MPSQSNPRASTLQAVRRSSFLPRALKYAIGLIFLLNIRSIPLLWHFRIFSPALRLVVHYRLLCLRNIFKSAEETRAWKQRWFRGLMPLGQDPFTNECRYQSWASPDECDYNFHLSNSSYPKALDRARLKAAVVLAPTFFRAGGWIGLGAMQHHFIREIPMFAPYEVRLSIGGWDEKWLYIVARFVSHSKRKIANATQDESKLSRDGQRDKVLPYLHTPTSPLDTPPRSTTPNLGLRTPVEPDGATLHCIAVSALCYKIGRLTVPPALALAAEGFRDRAATTKLPDWPDLREYRSLLAGGWRNVPEEERWWKEALGGEVERKRAAQLPSFEAVRQGMLELKEFR